MPTVSPLLIQPFRLLFMGAALFASLGITLWSLFLHLGLMAPTVLPPILWHGHEMLFGFASALVGGFLLTAVPNWTGFPTTTPVTLLLLAALWIAARVAFLVPGVPYGVTATLDCIYYPALTVMVGIPIIRKRDFWHLIVIAILAGLTTLNVVFHLSVAGVVSVPAVTIFAWVIDFLTVMMVAVGGRIIPFFTERRLPAVGMHRVAWVERATNAGPMIVTIVDIATPSSAFVGVLSLILAVLILIRLSGWQTWAVRGEPMLWVLHLGYLWLAVGLALRAGALLTHQFPEITALHAITAGALGTLSIGMMTRVPLGHTGRTLAAGKTMTIAFVLINVAAVLRVGAPSLVPLAGLLWALAFAVYFVKFLPIHFGPLRVAREDLNPGGK